MSTFTYHLRKNRLWQQMQPTLRCDFVCSQYSLGGTARQTDWQTKIEGHDQSCDEPQAGSLFRRAVR